MTKFEKYAWATGVVFLVYVVFLCSFHELFFSNAVDGLLVRLAFVAVLVLGLNLTAYLWRQPWADYTKSDFQMSHKATALTFYGVAAIAFLLLLFTPKEVSRDTVAVFIIYTAFIFISIRHLLLAYLLRKERLANAAPHPNPLPAEDQSPAITLTPDSSK